MTGVTVLHFLEGFTSLLQGIFFILTTERKPSDSKIWYLDVWSALVYLNFSYIWFDYFGASSLLLYVCQQCISFAMWQLIDHIDLYPFELHLLLCMCSSLTLI